jgi:hypothetical protein
VVTSPLPAFYEINAFFFHSSALIERIACPGIHSGEEEKKE